MKSGCVVACVVLFPFLVAFHSQPKIKKNWFHFIQGGFFISLWTSEILIESARRRERKKSADRLRATCWRVINTRSSDSEKNPHSSRKRKFFSLISPAAPEKEEFNCSFYYYYFVCELETHITIARLQKKSVAFKSNLPGNAPPNVLCRFFFPGGFIVSSHWKSCLELYTLDPLSDVITSSIVVEQ